MRTVDEIKQEMTDQYIYLFKLMREDRGAFDIFFVYRILDQLDLELCSLVGVEPSWRIMLRCIEAAMRDKQEQLKAQGEGS